MDASAPQDDFLTFREAASSAEEKAASERQSGRIVEFLIAQGVTHVVGIPDNQSRPIYSALESCPQVRIVRVCREGEAFAIASGLYAGGAVPAVLIQNTGLLEAGDSLRGTAREMGVPLLCLVGYRGFRSVGTDRVDSVAVVTEPTLSAWRVPYRILPPGREGDTLKWALDLARRESRPVAVLMP